LDYLNSQLRSLDVDISRVEAVLGRYGLERIAAPRNLTNTRRNWNLIVLTNRGKKILKLYRRDWPVSTISFEHSVLGELAKLGFPAPRLLMTEGGKTWVESDQDYFCMFEFIEGKNYSSSFLARSHRMRMMHTAGRMLARMHQQLPGFLPQGRHHIGFRNYTGDRHRDLPWHIEKVRDLTNRSRRLRSAEDREAAHWLIAQAGQMLDDMASLDAGLRGSGLPRLLIHGDFGIHNLIYQSLDQAVPVDYELCRLEWRLSDLVSVVSKFRYKDGSYDLESIACFLRAYQREFPIPDEEWSRFPKVWRYYKLMKAIQYWSSYFETQGPVRKLRSARHELERATWAMHHPNELARFRAGAA
jgi:Ser/Thr protein kinase RdoA (MazF antagonist)